jgi:SPP1 family predicted phage head-tail adaptor
MEAGELRRVITIQTLTETPDGQGGITQGWSTFRHCWAAVKPMGGDERQQYAQLYPSASVHVTVRYTAGLSPKQRILYGSRVFDVLAVVDDEERHRQVDLICKELPVST